MGTSTLSWFADRGFELTTEVGNDEVSLRFESVPVPADGLGEMRQGVDLNDLDILFKAVVEIEGQLAQVRKGSVKLLQEAGTAKLELDTECEDVETGEIVVFKTEFPVELPPEAPEAGGPRPASMTEDDLDLEDDTTLERIVMGGPEPSSSGPKPEMDFNDGPTGARGLKRLMAAITADAGGAPEPEAGMDAAAPLPEPEPEPGDQSMGAADEARGLLDYLIKGEHLELEEGAEVDSLVPGAIPILAGLGSAEAKASKLGSWLLDQSSVADLYIGDEDLAAILDQW